MLSAAKLWRADLDLGSVVARIEDIFKA